ncbi:MAG: hypothetical protein ROW39_05610 [Anaerolineaceae bacterium]|jgi:hypothetical protein
MPYRKLILALNGILILLLAACQAVTVSPAVPTPVTWQVRHTATVSWLGADFNQCMLAQPHARLIIFETPAVALEPAVGSFAFRWGAPPDFQGFAAIIGWDELTMIVHPDNPVESLTLANIIDIYSGAATNWEKIDPSSVPMTGRIHPWVYPDGNDVMDIFISLTAGPLQQDAVLYLAPDPQAMIDAVANDVAAIGFIPGRWLDARVRAISISDVDAEALRQPILSLDTAEPVGEQRAWLLCLQHRLERQ